MVLLGLYLEHVIPREHGKRYHPCFCFMKSFWSKRNNRINKDKNKQSIHEDFFELNKQFETKYMNEQYYEGVPPSIARMEAGDKIMKIQDMEKTYDNGTKAV